MSWLSSAYRHLYQIRLKINMGEGGRERGTQRNCRPHMTKTRAGGASRHIKRQREVPPESTLCAVVAPLPPSLSLAVPLDILAV